MKNRKINCHCEPIRVWQPHKIASHTFAMTGETGRSMVEMLGVLAIIGVLSVAGIAGYTNAMRSYRTNEIVNAISTLYVMGMTQNQGQGTGKLEYSSIGTNPSGATLVYENKAITATITDENDCKMVKNKLGDKAGECTATTGAYTLSVSFGETTSSTPDNEENCIQAGKYWLGPNKSENYLYDQFGCYDSEDDVSKKCQGFNSSWWQSCVDHICECQNE